MPMNKSQTAIVAKVLGISILCLTFRTAHTQIERNFTMGPSNSTCDSMKIDGTTDLAKTIKETKFRFSQEIKVSRYKTPRHAWFYSCDGKTGYLIARETEELEYIYEAVTKEDWDAFFNAKDPIAAYAELKAKYSKQD